MGLRNIPTFREPYTVLTVSPLACSNVQTQLGPLNEELKIVNAHFEKIISVKKQELDDRRKNNSLGKFLAERVSSAKNLAKRFMAKNPLVVA